MASTKEKCKYWGKCYRKDKQHLGDYLHVGDLKKADEGIGHHTLTDTDLSLWLCLKSK